MFQYLILSSKPITETTAKKETFEARNAVTTCVNGTSKHTETV